MKKTFYMLPRQCGKTTMAIMEFLRSPETTLIVVHNQGNVKKTQEVIKKIVPYISHLALGNVISSSQIPSYCMARKFDKIIVDEYMHHNERYFQEMKLHLYSCLSQNSELIVYSSADRVYSKKVLDFLREISNIPMAERLKEYALFSEEEKADFDRLSETFLADPEFKIITSSPVQHSPLYHNRTADIEKCIGKEAYDMEISNIFLK